MADMTNTDNILEAQVAKNAEAQSAITPENEMAANLSMDQLSYICEYCGKINAIVAPNCVRCGKRRPRSEYINAMNKIKNAQSIKSQYIEEQARLDADRDDANQRQLARLVEERVADEKAQLEAQKAIQMEQEADEIKRNTARDAVLRIIAAERAAEEKVRSADLRAEEAIKGRNRETQETIAAEREKVLYAAAKRLVSERAGIENAAEERIVAERNLINQKAQETIDASTEAAEREAARKAALKVIAAEQASADRSNIEREAIQRAALDRVAEERHIAEINAYSKFTIEKEAIERAVDERIKAERELLYGKRNSAVSYGGQGAGTVQPIAIVPYVNSQQPVYQYNNIKQIYRFVPDEQFDQGETKPQQRMQTATVVDKKKRSCKAAVRVCSLFAFLFGALMILACVLDIEALRFVDGVKNLDLVMGLFGSSSVIVDGLIESTNYILPIGIIVAAVGALVSVVCGIIGLISNKACAVLPIAAAVAVVGAALIPVSRIIGGTELSEVFAEIGNIIIIALAAVMLVFASIAAGKTAAEKKNAVMLTGTTK